MNRKQLVHLLICAALPAAAQDLYRMPSGRVETRWASPENPLAEKGAGAKENAGRKGRPFISIPAGGEAVLAEARGTSGTLRRIWLSFGERSPRFLRGLRLQMFWDEARTPAVDAPLGDYFGHMMGRMAPFQSAFFSSPEGRSFVCHVPMPFRRAMRVVVRNESGRELPNLYYDIDYTLGDAHGEDVLYFHAHFRRENPTTLQKDYEFLPLVRGRGRFLGVFFGVIVDQKKYSFTWWGEGEAKIYLDGDRDYPTLVGTGTEDYIGTAWGQGRFDHLYQGCPVADSEKMQFSFYRFHVPDPIYFYEDIRATIQQIGYLNPRWMGLVHQLGTRLYKAGPGLVERGPLEEGLFERQDDWSSVAYFYLHAPENGLPPAPPVEERLRGLD
jgi:hypothetical protein